MEILRQIKDSVFSKIPVILITGKGDEEIAARALRIGAFDYVIKNQGYLYKLPSSIENAYSSIRLEREHEALLESEKRYRSLFENHHTIMLLIDPEKEVIVDANPAALWFYGWSKEAFQGKPVSEINTLPPEKHREILRAALKRDRNHFIFKHYLADGSIRDVEVYSGPIEMGGKSFLYSMVYDITKRFQEEKEKEKLRLQLIQAQKMESVGRLAGGVAHDYNNMLSVIIGYATVAIEKLSPNSTLHSDISMILRAANRSVEITRQLLAFARRQPITPKVLNLNDTVASMMKMLQRLIGEDIHLSWEPGDDLWPVKIDPVQVDQILANLSVNARDAIENVGKVAIQTKSVILDESYCRKRPGFKPGEFVMLAVSDNGCGMDQEVLANAFDPFFTTKEVGYGTGLGLSTVYGIVKQNKGLIDIESEPGKGTTIRIYFPKYEKEAVRVLSAAPFSTPAGAGEMVLVVEDEPLLLKLTEKMLTKLGYKVIGAETPTKALKLAESHVEEIALLLTDVVMPEMTGRELAEKMKLLFPNLNVLYMSGYAANLIAHHGVLESGVCFIPKPFSESELATEVKKALNSSPT